MKDSNTEVELDSFKLLKTLDKIIGIYYDIFYDVYGYSELLVKGRLHCK